MPDPLSLLGTAGGAAAKPAGSLVSSTAKKRTWAIRTAWAAFRGDSRPRPRWALARWLKSSRVADGVLTLSAVPAGAAEDLDGALCRASRRWAAQPTALREARAQQVLNKAHTTVLDVRDGHGATRVASQRQAADAQHAREQVADVAADVKQILHRTEPDAGAPDRLRLEARLSGLPPATRQAVVQAWDEAPDATWALVASLSDMDCPPDRAAEEWETYRPSWLKGAPTRVLTLAGELAAAYGATRTARALFADAVAAGANRRSYWAARAAALYDLDEHDQAVAVLAAGGDPDTSVEPLARAMSKVLGQDWDGARDILRRWRPDDTTGWALWFSLSHRVAGLAAQGRPLDRALLDEILAASDTAIQGAREHGPVPTGLRVVAARYLVMRQQMGASDSPAGDLRRALELALSARDDRRPWHGDTAEAVEWACAAAVASGDYRRAVKLGTVEGDASPAEAANPAVRRHVAVAKAGLGTLDALPNTDGTTEFGRHSLLALHAMANDQDTAPMWRAALAAAEDDNERVTALAGLARAGGNDLTGLDEIEARFPDVGAHVRALSEIAVGDYTSAIARLREPARTSPTAAMTLAEAYDRSGRLDDAVEALQAAAERFADPDMALAAVKLRYRQGDKPAARAGVDDLLAAAPEGWPGRPEALQLAAQLAVDAADAPKAIALLRTSLDQDAYDARARWALARLLLGRGKDDDAHRVLQAHPEPLRALEPIHAHVWLDAHRRHLPAAELARGAVGLARSFPDSETVAAHAIIVVVSPRADQDAALPADVLADVHAVQRDFFERWPDSQHLRAVTFDANDPQGALDELERMVAVDDDTARARRLFHRQLVRQQLPLGSLSTAVRRSYAEVVLARGLGTLPAWHPDPAEHQASLADADAALDGPVVVETTSLLVLTLLDQSLRGTLLGSFSAAEITDATLTDIRTAADTAAGRSTASFVYDDVAKRAVLVETSEQAADRHAQEAAALAELAALLTARPNPPVDPDDPSGRDWGPWMAAARVAAVGRSVLWADDASLRVFARALGAKAFSTAALLTILAARGAVSGVDNDDALSAMVAGRIGGIPLSPSALQRAAECDGWQAGSAALTLSDPSLWVTPAKGLALLDAVLPSVARHRPDAAAGWAYAAAVGIGHAHDDAKAVARLAGTVLAAAAHRLGASPADTAALVAAVRQGLADSSLDPDTAPDPVPDAAAVLMDALSHAIDAATAAPYVMATFSALDGQDRAAVARSVLGA